MNCLWKEVAERKRKEYTTNKDLQEIRRYEEIGCYNCTKPCEHYLEGEKEDIFTNGIFVIRSGR